MPVVGREVILHILLAIQCKPNQRAKQFLDVLLWLRTDNTSFYILRAKVGQGLWKDVVEARSEHYNELRVAG